MTMQSPVADQGQKNGVLAYAKVNYTGGACTITKQSGDFDPDVVVSATGVVVLELKQGMDGDSVYVDVSVDGALAASQLTDFGVEWVDDTHIRITILREGAAGAVSALTANIPFKVLISGPTF